MIRTNQIHFNPVKHHLLFVCAKLKDSITNERASFLESIQSINSNFVDLYTGQYSPEEIKEKLVHELTKLKIYCESEYIEWLANSGYRTITLDDGAKWILRKSENKEAFVHVHPSRVPPLTVRVHGNAWKTVVGFLAMNSDGSCHIPTLAQINNFRKEFLDLSPVKGNENLKRVKKVLDLIQDCMINNPLPGR